MFKVVSDVVYICLSPAYLYLTIDLEVRQFWPILLRGN